MILKYLLQAKHLKSGTLALIRKLLGLLNSQW